MTITVKRVLIRVTAIAAMALGLFAGLLGLGYVANNGEDTMPTSAHLAASQLRAVEWVRRHEEEVVATNNAMLWWMVRESAALSNDAYLVELYRRYHQRHLAPRPNSPWHHLFDPEIAQPIPVGALTEWPDYNLLFLYGLSCQDSLRDEPRVVGLRLASACGEFGSLAYFRDPACLTHQLMGIRFAQERHCDDAVDTNALVATLVDKITEATAGDFRMVDFYLQRLMMLAESGHAEHIQARWLLRVMEAQRPDGGWDDFDPLIDLGDWAIGWSGRSLRLRKPDSNFHTTAQGLYLMSLLAKTSQTGIR